MTFYERYAHICQRNGFDPCSQRMAEMLGTSRAAISTWSKKGSTPMGETVAAVASALHVSTDYLLGRTDDPIDYSDPDIIANLSTPVLDQFEGDVLKAVAFQNAVDNDALTEHAKYLPYIEAYNRLDPIDQGKVEAYMQGLLSNDKYAAKKKHA